MGATQGILLALSLVDQLLTSASRYQSLVANAVAEGRDVDLSDIAKLQSEDDAARKALQDAIDAA